MTAFDAWLLEPPTTSQPAASDSINLQIDWTTSLAINAGAAVIFSPSVLLAIAATSSAGAVTDMRFSDNGTDWSAWESYATTRAYTLSGTTTGPAINSTYYIVYVDFRDDDGNTTEDMDTAELTQGTIVYKDARTVSNVMPPVYAVA